MSTHTMKKYWKSLDELKHSEGNNQQVKMRPDPEFSVEGLNEAEKTGKASRRDFLKMLGFTVGYATLASSCEMPVRKAIPYLNKPEEVTPGEANHYASTFFDGRDYCSVLVKVREGRPIKIEGNELSKITKGGTSARVQASILNLYDTTRLKKPLKEGQKTEWKSIDQEITDELGRISETEKEIVLLSSSIISPSMKQIIRDFQEKYPGTKWVTYDAVSSSAMISANEASFGKAAIPTYRFDKADVIAAFNADFLGNWLSSIEYIKGYAKKRDLLGEDSMSRHIQFESLMSLTGSNADERHQIKPSEEQQLLLALYNEIASAKGEQTFGGGSAPESIRSLAAELLNNQGRSLVVCGTNNASSQRILNAINYLLGNYGKTIDLNKPLYIRQGRDEEMQALVGRMNRGDVGALITYNCNPSYNYHAADGFAEGLKKVDLTISLAPIEDETAANMKYVCPDHNYLESWGDAEAVKGHLSLGQPTIHKLFDTRQAGESLLKWAGRDVKIYDYIKNYWKENIFPLQEKYIDFESFWTQCLHDGIYEIPAVQEADQPEWNPQNLSAERSNGKDGLELVLYETIPIGSGEHANNPWLQELPEPISKVTWDNYVNVSPRFAEENNLEHEDLVSIDGKFELPVIVQPGHPYGVVSIALGYGRKSAGRVANNVGQNVYPFVVFKDGHFGYSDTVVKLDKTGEKYPLALTQAHHEMEGRPIVRETSLAAWKESPDAGNKLHEKVEKQHVSLYETPEFPNLHWGLAVNLNSCVGCGACEIACQAENNIAVIGKEEVRKRRIMHWIRIDRYYSEDKENPEVFHQPVMCQHCDNAPCENVCPVAATPHSNEGLNMMAYNRCIGTRYCMNNCPYRVRRFNWFEYVNNNKFPYNLDNQLGKMALNPDVTVRSRGVVEKCSFCSQRLQDKKLLAKREGRKLKDGEVKVACQQACPANAIEFGDLNNKDSRISKAFANPRNYHLLEELHTLPSVGYLTKVRNKTEKA